MSAGAFLIPTSAFGYSATPDMTSFGCDSMQMPVDDTAPAACRPLRRGLFCAWLFGPGVILSTLPFLGGTALSGPLHVLGMLWYALRDRIKH
ncbi:hypothetical protein NKH80_08235 [Mesorhizobium sp. M0904]